MLISTADQALRNEQVLGSGIGPGQHQTTCNYLEYYVWSRGPYMRHMGSGKVRQDAPHILAKDGYDQLQTKEKIRSINNSVRVLRGLLLKTSHDDCHVVNIFI